MKGLIEAEVPNKQHTQTLSQRPDNKSWASSEVVGFLFFFFSLRRAHPTLLMQVHQLELACKMGVEGAAAEMWEWKPNQGLCRSEMALMGKGRRAGEEALGA